MIYTDLTELWHSECERLILGDITEGVHRVGQHVMVFDQQVEADSMAYEFDISHDLWMTKGRFTTLQNDYLDPAALEHFVSQSQKVQESKRPSISQMLCRVKGKRHVSYSWGNCILGFTYRSRPVPTFSMHSRISSVTRMGGLDLALAYLVMSEFADPAETRFVWHVGCLLHSPLNGMPYLMASGLYKTVRKWRPTPGVYLSKREMAYFDRLDAEGRIGKHGTRRRIREQRRAFLAGEMERPRVPLSSLSLDPLKEK